MNNFKIQTIGLSQKRAEPQKEEGIKITNRMEESVRLNYEIDKLVQILNAHFEDYEFSINIIVRCLKIMSVSLRDDELRQSIENMIGRNEHNGLKIYKLFVYLCSFQKNIEGIVGKFNRECQEIMISKMLSIYLFTKEFDKKLSVQIEGILQIEVENECILKVLKNQYLGYGLPLLTLLQKIRMLKLKSKGRKLIIGLLQHCLNKSQNELLKLLREYRDNMKDIDYVLDKFPELSTLMVGKVQLLFDARTIIQYMEYVEGHRLQTIAKLGVREWVNKDNNYWKLVQAQFGNYQYRKRILALGQQLENQKQFNQYITKQYLYLYFKGFSFRFNEENALQEKVSMPIVSEMVKVLFQCSSKSVFNIIVMNKIYSPKWEKESVMDNPHSVFKSGEGKQMMSKLSELYQKIYNKSIKNNKNIQLCYSVITVLDKQNNKTYYLTYKQLVRYLESKELKDQFMSEYGLEKREHVKENKVKDSNIVVQAHIVKLLKKNKGELSCEQISKGIGLQDGICFGGIKRLINKGMVSQKEQKYAYLP